MKRLALLPLAVAAAIAMPVLAQNKPAGAVVMAASAPGQGAAAGAVRLTATVVAIDAATRTVTLKGTAKGKVVDLQVPPEAKNFDQIRIGDSVTAEYMQAISLRLEPAGGMRSSTTQAASAPKPAGAVAGGSAARQVVIMADVTAVNAKAGTVTLRGPKGNVVDVSVPDPAQLKRVKVGDQVEAVYTEALAIRVDHTPAKK